MRELYGPRTRFLTYGQRVPLLRRFGLSAEDVLGTLDERAAFARFGAQG